MKVFKPIVILIFILITSCNADNKRYNTMYHYQLKFFKKEFVSHMDIATNPSFSYSISKSGEYNVTGIILTDKNDYKTYKNIYDTIAKVAIASYLPTDSCLLVINTFTTQKNLTHKKRKANSLELELLERDCLRDKLPIPNFYDFDAEVKTRCKLSEDYELYVLEAKKGIYWDEKYLTDGRYMPTEWKHGYSKGVAFNKVNYNIIYWFEIWQN